MGTLETEIVLRTLEEDGVSSDLTTLAIVDKAEMGLAVILAKSHGVLAGIEIAQMAMELNSSLRFTPKMKDGDAFAPASPIAEIEGDLRDILSRERVALNFLQQLSGIATQTRAYVTLSENRTKIFDTRKTSPTLRSLERMAVRAGGGYNHRFNLASAILIKDNHIKAAGGIQQAIRKAKLTGLPIEVEVESLEQLQVAMAEQIQIVLLDNMSCEQVAQAVKLVAGQCLLEVSGNVSLANIKEYALCGVDRISVGALTHSAPASDISMEVIKTWLRT